MEKRNRIIVDNVNKKFKIGFIKNQSVLSKILSIFSGKENKKTLVALKNISFGIKEGEIVGIVGDNGSGKSTLLRCIARIYSKDSGKIGTKGKVISLINLKLGMQQRIDMKENIFLTGTLFGMTKKEIKKRFISIINFSGLNDFINTKIYQFSEGMKQRLVFSIAIHCNPKILLLDEIFEVGDGDFKKRSANKIKELVKQGASVLLVSHDLDLIKKHCNKIIWMEKGKIFKEGKTKEIIKEYKRRSNQI